MKRIEKNIDGWAVMVDFGEFLPKYNSYRVVTSIRKLPDGLRFGRPAIMSLEFIDDKVAMDIFLDSEMIKLRAMYDKTTP